MPWFRALLSSAVLAIALLPDSAGLRAEPQDTTPPNAEIVLGTATRGGGFQLFGQHLVEVVNAVDPELHAGSIATRGSKQNLSLLAEGKIDFGLIEGNAAHDALQATSEASERLMVLSVMYPNPGMFVVLADSPYRSIDDLRGNPVAFGTRASGLRILANDVLDGLGLSPTADFDQLILDKAADGPRMVLVGEASALWGAGIGWPGFVEVTESSHGGRFIAPNRAQIEAILAKHPHLRRMSVPAGTYRGQDERIDSVGLWSVILVRADLPEAIAYRLARALHRGEDLLAERLPQGRYATAANTVEQVPQELIHPGAMRFYREAGIVPRTADAAQAVPTPPGVASPTGD